MPFRVSSGPSVGRAVIISHSASEALRLFKALQDEQLENVEVSHLDRATFTVEELEELAAAEREPD